MINDENKTEIIDLYLEGSLSEELQREVEERMQTDPLFRQEVAVQKKVIKVIQEEERSKLKEEMKVIFEEDDNQQAKVIPIQRSRFSYAVAAAVSLLLIAAALFFVLRPTDAEVQYLAVSLPTGTRGELPDGVPKKFPVQIDADNQQYNFHYQLGDTLKLYGSFSWENLSLVFEPNRRNYMMLTPQDTFLLLPSETIQPLQP